MHGRAEDPGDVQSRARAHPSGSHGPRAIGLTQVNDFPSAVCTRDPGAAEAARVLRVEGLMSRAAAAHGKGSANNGR